jgi:hypothetical protein
MARAGDTNNADAPVAPDPAATPAPDADQAPAPIPNAPAPTAPTTPREGLASTPDAPAPTPEARAQAPLVSAILPAGSPQTATGDVAIPGAQAPAEEGSAEAEAEPREHLGEWAITHERTGQADLMNAFVRIEMHAGHVYDVASAWQASFDAFVNAPA